MMDENPNQPQNLKFPKCPFGKKNQPDLRSFNRQWRSKIYLFIYSFKQEGFQKALFHIFYLGFD